MIIGLLGFLVLLAALGLMVGSYLTNPFSRLSIIKLPYTVKPGQAGLVATNENDRLKVRQQPWWRWFAVAKCGVHILYTRYISSPRSDGQTVAEIIHDIHLVRFDPEKLLVISGDHFSALFVRNLGVFYYPLLDGRIGDSAEDWYDRQAVYLQTVAYGLGVFAKQPVPTTTIVPTGQYAATCVNFYAYPSDTVYGLMYGVAALMGLEGQGQYGFTAGQSRVLQTASAARELLERYQDTLRRLYGHYRNTVYDEAGGLVRRDVHLSGAKDITPRTSSFYDNVIFWKTTELAGRLGVVERDEAFLRTLKYRIIEQFWLEKEGYFLEDLSDEGRERKYYSSDWLIVLATGFLDPANVRERVYFERSVAYAQEQEIDKPFAIKYQQDTRGERQHWLVRWAVASYGGDAIWSFWGMEYIKVLALLYRATGKGAYLEAADYHLAAYRTAMVKYGGFPEVYDAQGRLLQTLLYRSIRQTGWVVGFEQAEALYNAVAPGQKVQRPRRRKVV